ncbi:MAG TPA: 2OG-Fe(II) oxygenase [Sphingomicrobium sp.]|nr:2OG-Fe(II) oxygenase [Sphingomicrobium sp.]
MVQTLPSLADAYSLVAAGRVPEAVAMFEQLGAAGDGEALFTLGDALWRGLSMPQDVRRGRDLFKRSSDNGFDVGRRAYTNLLASGIAGERNWGQALRRLEEEAADDTLRAQMLELIRAMPVDADGNPSVLPLGESLSDRPHVMLYRAAFSRAECDYLQWIAQFDYQPTRVVVAPGQQSPANIRTAEGSTIYWLIEDPAIHAMNRRLASLSGMDVDHGEPLQILRYHPGQEYRPHFDWLDQGNRRVMTALVYLNDDYDGGETAFTRIGLKVKGRTGDVLIFSSRGADGNLELLSEHAGLPVTRGTKYLASRWIREGRAIP